MDAYGCTAGHLSGNAPQIVALDGNSTRLEPLFLVRHGGEYVASNGQVVRHPQRMNFGNAKRAIEIHRHHVA